MKRVLQDGDQVSELACLVHALVYLHHTILGSFTAMQSQVDQDNEQHHHTASVIDLSSTHIVHTYKYIVM